MVCDHEEGEMLKDIAKLDILVFGKIPMKELVQRWYDETGAKPDYVICPECIIK